MCYFLNANELTADPKISLTCYYLFFLNACAQIVPPQGGAKDVTPPKLLSVNPEDSLLNTRVNRIEMRFDEFITLNNAASEVTISPILPFPLDLSVLKRTVTVKIPDSLLQDNTTYRISFGKAIQDVHENNPFTGYSYMFSTGSYFDSLQLSGYVTDAATGQRDTGALVMLYDAKKSDSAVVREKPLYAVKTDNTGNFHFAGLPSKSFKIYALRDGNNNMIYDGSGEMIAFADSIVYPSVQNNTFIRLNLFAETDTSGNIATAKTDKGSRLRAGNNTPAASGDGFNYTVDIDTSDVKKRTVEITKPIKIIFSKPVAAFNSNRINLSYDSLGITTEAEINHIEDTMQKNVLFLNSNWKENTVYTLRLLKGFARDSAGTDAMPGRYSFRTKRDEDYAKLHVHLPSEYFGNGYVFVLLRGNDTVYQQPVSDTMIHFYKLQPATYTMRVIVDKNKNGKWNTGKLLEKIQPEEVIPYNNIINLKAGWENMIDFKEEKKPSGESDLSPDKKTLTE